MSDGTRLVCRFAAFAGHAIAVALAGADSFVFAASLWSLFVALALLESPGKKDDWPVLVLLGPLALVGSVFDHRPRSALADLFVYGIAVVLATRLGMTLAL